MAKWWEHLALWSGKPANPSSFFSSPFGTMRSRVSVPFPASVVDDFCDHSLALLVKHTEKERGRECWIIKRTNERSASREETRSDTRSNLRPACYANSFPSNVDHNGEPALDLLPSSRVFAGRSRGTLGPPSRLIAPAQRLLQLRDEVDQRVGDFWDFPPLDRVFVIRRF